MNQGVATGKSPQSFAGAVSTAQQKVRAGFFVGREAELADFAQHLAACNVPRIVYVHGPGGIGKSSLLDGFGQIAQQAGRSFSRLDARQLSPTPEGVRQAVTTALEALPPHSGSPRVLALDQAEQLSALDSWLRSSLLPDLPGDLIFILAARQGPDVLWRADPGITEFLTEYPLRPLTCDTVADYLQRRGVDYAQVQAIQDFACGYPLPLALAVDQVHREPGKVFNIGQFPDLIRALVQWLLNDVEHPAELQALQACASVRRLDEPLLAAMLDNDTVSQQYDWLADQHYVERQADGVVIHDLVRELVVLDLRGRNLDWHNTLVRRAARHLLGGRAPGFGQFQRRTVPDVVYALRHEEHIRAQFGFGQVHCYPDAAQPQEIAGLADEVEQLEGKESRRWFESWLPSAFSELLVLRSGAGQPVAFILFLRVNAQDMLAEHEDPCLQAFVQHLRKHAPLRDAEQVLFVRHRMAHGTHQAPSPVWAELRAHLIGRMFTPGISMLACVTDMAYSWEGMEENAEYALLADSGYCMGGREYKTAAHDLRSEPALEWAQNSVERILSSGQAPELKPDPVALLEKPAFAQAVRDVLRHYHDEQALARTPLLQSPMLRRHSREHDVASLRELIEHASARLEMTVHEILMHACFNPVATKQQAIASELYISERTLRRRLRDAQEQLIEALWKLDTAA